VVWKNILSGIACIQEAAEINIQTTPDTVPLFVHCSLQQHANSGKSKYYTIENFVYRLSWVLSQVALYWGLTVLWYITCDKHPHHYSTVHSHQWLNNLIFSDSGDLCFNACNIQ
jgi:hypothetical protein